MMCGGSWQLEAALIKIALEHNTAPADLMLRSANKAPAAHGSLLGAHDETCWWVADVLHRNPQRPQRKKVRPGCAG